MSILRESEHLRGGASLAGAAFIYATFGLIVREMENMYNLGAQVFAGYFLAFLALTVFIFGFRNSLQLDKRGLAKAIALGVTSGGAMILFTVAIIELKIASAVFLFYAGGMLSSIPLGMLLLKERFTSKKAVILLLALGGIALFGDMNVSMGWGSVAGISAGLMTSVSNTLRKSLKSVPRHTITWTVSGVTSVMAIPIALLSSGPVVHDPTFLPILATIAYGASRIGLTYLMLYGFKHIDVSVGSVLLATELVFSAVLGCVFLGENPTLQELCGGVLVMAGAVLAAIPDRVKVVAPPLQPLSKVKPLTPRSVRRFVRPAEEQSFLESLQQSKDGEGSRR